MWIAITGVASTLGGMILGAFLSHYLSNRRARQRAGQDVLATQRAKAYAPIEKLVELAEKGTELFAWPHRGKWGKIHKPDECKG